MPIFVMREWVRHRIGFSVNEESGRYVQMRPDFYIPRLEDVRGQVGKPGNYTFERVSMETASEFCELLDDHSALCYERYLYTIEELGVAKELARLFLPLNLYTEIRWTANARSLMNFLSLRNSPDAMREIRAYAYEMEGLFATAMPNVHQYFVEAGRVAP